MQHLLEHRGFILIAIGYTVFLTMGSLINIGEVSEVPNNFDKVVHFAAYFGLASLWMFWSIFRYPSNKPKPKLKVLTGIALVSIIYGIIIELLQGMLTTYRMADGWDIFANTLGVVSGLIIVLLLITKTSLLKTKF